jgi:rare lipoprotein A
MALTGCARVHKDGPPGYDVDVSRIPNAVPKRERLAKYGNMPYYNVFGKRYYTLKSSANYNKVGVASWYGTKFHARRTSSGEPYDMLSMTAAHKTLPLPTYVEVTNLRNHKTIIVKVNDRGPFSSNRIIDLSYVAAKKLGMLGHGTTNVRVRAINPDSYDSGPRYFAHNIQRQRQQSESDDSIYMQVGAFRNIAYAKRLKHRLSSQVSVPVIISREHNSRLYNVKIGPIKDLAASKHIEAVLKRKGIKPHIIA